MGLIAVHIRQRCIARTGLMALASLLGLAIYGCGGQQAGTDVTGAPRLASTVNPPTNVAATDGTLGDRVRVSWTAAAGADYYQVWRSATSTTGFALIGTSTGTHYDDMQSTTTVYFYKVRAAVGGVGYSIFVGPDAGHAGVNAPTNVAATDWTYTDHVRVTWTAASGATFYQVYRSTSETGTYSLLASPTGTAYNDYISGIAPYYYKVRAGIGGVGYSAFAGPDPGNAGLEAPTNVAASDGTYPDHIHVTWTAANSVDYYQVWRASSQTGTYVLIGSTTGTQFDENWNNGVTYWYKVRSASSGVGYSCFAGPDSGYDGP